MSNLLKLELGQPGAVIHLEEIQLIERIFAPPRCSRRNVSITKVERRSGRLYDLTVHGWYELESPTRSGEIRPRVPFSGWLPLAFIQELVVWTAPQVAELSDHPDMARAGDWSGIRDSSHQAIWRIFRRAVR